MSEYYLLEHRNPYGPHFYTSRRKKVTACVIHVTAGLQGIVGKPDQSAEKTAAYAASTDRPVSWHSGSDCDTHLHLLPDDHTAFHVQGYNSSTIGHEISKRDVTWADEDPLWVTKTLNEAADCLRPRLRRLGIPLRKASKAELDAALARGGMPVGLISHSDLDPSRRRDPGPDFPWQRFLALLSQGHYHATPELREGVVGQGQYVKDLQGHLNAWRKNRQLSLRAPDGKFESWTREALRTFQGAYGLSKDGVCGKNTWRVVHEITKGVKA